MLHSTQILYNLPLTGRVPTSCCYLEHTPDSSHTEVSIPGPLTVNAFILATALFWPFPMLPGCDCQSLLPRLPSVSCT